MASPDRGIRTVIPPSRWLVVASEPSGWPAPPAWLSVVLGQGMSSDCVNPRMHTIIVIVQLNMSVFGLIRFFLKRSFEQLLFYNHFYFSCFMFVLFIVIFFVVNAFSTISYHNLLPFWFFMFLGYLYNFLIVFHIAYYEMIPLSFDLKNKRDLRKKIRSIGKVT